MSENDYIDGDYEENLPVIAGKGTAVATIATPTMSLDLSTPEALDRAVQQVINGIEYKDKIMTLAIRTARPGAIKDLDGKPLFGEHECERIMSLLGGGSIVIVQPPTYTPDENGHFGYMAAVEVRHPILGCFQGWGSAYSEDKFLGTNKGKVSSRGKTKSLDQVERHNIAQHALTRAKGAALRNMLGLYDLDWADLEKWGFRPETAGASVEYRKGGADSGGNPTKRKSTMTAVGKRFYAVCCDRWTKEKIPYKQLSDYAREESGYTGDKILSAPDDVLEAVLLAVREGIIDGMIGE